MPQKPPTQRRHELIQLSLKKENKAWLINHASTAGFGAPSQLADLLIEQFRLGPLTITCPWIQTPLPESPHA